MIFGFSRQLSAELTWESGETAFFSLMKDAAAAVAEAPFLQG